MKTTRSLRNVAGALLGLSLLTSAWSGPKDAPCVWLTEDLIGMKVISEQGESLGKIEDIVVHPGGQTAYAVLSFGGWLGMGEKLFAMPWTVLRTVEPDTAKEDSKRSLVLLLDKQRLEAAPGFDKKNWPTMANPDWAKDVDAFYVNGANTDAKKPVPASARTPGLVWRVSELKGTDVETPTGENLGEIEELAIDVDGRVSYVALSVGGFLGTGERIVAVPWDSMKYAVDEDDKDEMVITLASTKAQLEQAPQFREGEKHEYKRCDPKWIERIYSHYSITPYWNLKGIEVGAKGSKD